jgi:hypothetical protein
MKSSTMNRIGTLAISLTMATGAACGVSGSTSSTTGSGTAGSSATGSSGSTGSGTAGSSTAGTGSGTGGSSTSGSSGSTGSGTAGSSSAGTSGGSGSSGTGGSSTGGSGGTGGSAGTGGSTGTGGTAPLSGITVTLGTTVVPKENAIAFLHFGHSNMAGRGVDPPETRPYFFGAPDPHAWMYHSGKGFQPAVEPNTAGDGGNMINGLVSGGPGTALVKEAAALAPDKYFIAVGFGQNAAYCSQFLPGALYYNKVMAGAMEIKDKVTWAGIMIYLGITERHGTQADIDNYPQCINKLVTQIRTDLGQPNLPMIINDYEMGTTGPLAPGCAFYNAIRPKEQMVPMVVSNSILIPTDNPIITIQDDHSTTDDHHFDLNGHKEYVRRLLAGMQAKGWFPWQ